MKWQKCAGCQGRHLVKLRELQGYPRGMHRWALIWLLASALAVLADEASASRHKHLSRHRKKAVEVEQHEPLHPCRGIHRAGFGARHRGCRRGVRVWGTTIRDRDRQR